MYHFKTLQIITLQLNCTAFFMNAGSDRKRERKEKMEKEGEITY